MMEAHTMAVPADVARSHEVSRSRAAQASVPTCSIASQCALQFTSSAGTQTEPLVDSAQAGASSERFPTLQYDVDSAEDAPEEEQGDDNSCSSYPGYTRDTVKDHERIQTEAEFCAASSHHQPKHQKSNLTIHAKGNASATPDPCTVLKKHFCQKAALLNHTRLHTGGKPYTGEKPYVCSVCQKSFLQKGHLVNHQRLHTGEKPYVCSVCQKGFMTKCNMVYHEKLHTSGKPYLCSVCQKSFAKKCHVVSHERMHTGEKPYVCSVCQKGFKTKNSLVSHKRLHTGERPYVCLVCQKSFAREDTLVKHQRLHTGERPYVCIICHKSFSQKGNLVRHEKRLHTGEKPQMSSI